MTASSNVVAHLARCCPQELAAPHAEAAEYKASITSALKGKLPSVEGPMASFLASSQPGDLPADLALMCLLDNRPFSLVEGAGFHEFAAQHLRGGGSPPSADTVARRAVQLDECLQTVLSRRLFPETLGYTNLPDVTVPPDTPLALFSATTDGWTSRSGVGYLGVTVHFLTIDFEPRSLVIALREFAPPHTAERHDELFTALLEENGLSMDALLTLTTDSARARPAGQGRRGRQQEAVGFRDVGDARQEGQGRGGREQCGVGGRGSRSRV